MCVFIFLFFYFLVKEKQDSEGGGPLDLGACDNRQIWQIWYRIEGRDEDFCILHLPFAFGAEPRDWRGGNTVVCVRACASRQEAPHSRWN